MKYQKLSQLVEQIYVNSSQDFAQWMWANHVPVVAKNTLRLAKEFGANPDLAVAGALLHDFGDAFVHRHDEHHEKISHEESVKALKESGYSEKEIQIILEEIIAPHSCKNKYFPRMIEGKVLATADALAHLTTDFYLQFAWKHLPENKTYPEFIEWVNEKLDRDFNNKIFFESVKEEVRERFLSLREVFRVE